MSSDRHIPALDGIRGMAAMFVVLSHFSSFALPDLLPRHIGDYGVLFFFVLSGFLMGHLYLPRRVDQASVASYAAARIARIVPLYFCIGALSFLLYSFVTRDFVYHIGAPELLRMVTFTSSVSVFWSIGPEFQFYFLFPMLWMAMQMGGRWRLPVLAAIGVFVVICYFAMPWLPGFSAFAKMHIFLAGIGCAMLINRLSEETKRRLFLPFFLFTILFLLLLVVTPAGLHDWIYPSTKNDPKHIGYYGDLLKLGAATLLIFGAAIRHPINDRLWGNALMRRLGAYSFSLYLLHMPALQLAKLVGDWLGMGPLAMSAWGLALSLLVAALSFELFERPTGRIVRGRLTTLFTRPRVSGHASPV